MIKEWGRKNKIIIHLSPCKLKFLSDQTKKTNKKDLNER